MTTDHPKSPQVYITFKPPVNQLPPVVGEGVKQPPVPVKQPVQAAIHNAAMSGDLMALAKELEADPASVDQRTGGSATPLMLAAKGGHVECMELLLKYGADVEVQDKVGMTALSHAAQANNLAAVRMLLDHHAEANTHDEIGTPLIWATGPKGSNDVVRELLAAKADVNAAGILNMTPLIWATGFSGTDRQPQEVAEVVKLLIKSGADLEKSGGPEQMTPLLYAVQRTTPQTVKALLDAGADLKAKDSLQRSALDLAKSRKDDDGQAIVKMLETKMGIASSDAPAPTTPAPKPGN